MIEAELKTLLNDSLTNSSCIWVAYSGGLDSTVLLHALAQIRDQAAVHGARPISLRAIHVHHGLSDYADSWVQHCQQQCVHLKVPLKIEKVTLQVAGRSIEEAARLARYAAFATYVQSGETLVLGHHRDDQVETVLMRLLRGGHSSLLASIPNQRLLNEALLIRPLLGVPKEALHDYACENHLSWVEDDSNSDTTIERNRIRHTLLPSLREKFPEIDLYLIGLAQAHKSLNALEHRLGEQTINKISIEVFHKEQGLSLALLASLTVHAQKALVRLWFRRRDLPQPSERIFDRIWTELITAKVEARPQVQWKNICAERYLGGLFVYVHGDRNVEHALPLLQTTQTFVPWSELSADEKIAGQNKKYWQNRFSIPPWRRSQLYVLKQGGHAMKVYDAQSRAYLI